MTERSDGASSAGAQIAPLVTASPFVEKRDASVEVVPNLVTPDVLVEAWPRASVEVGDAFAATA